MPRTQPAIPKRSFFRRLVRILLRTLLTVLIILLIVFFLIQTPFIQNIVRGKAETYLSRKLKTPVRIGGLSIVFFRRITLKDVYIEDRQRDTLLSAGLIDVQLRMLGLLHHDLDIQKIGLENVTVKIRRQLPDTAFNFQYIVDAFSGPPSAAAATTPGTPMKIGLKELGMDKIRFVYRDTVTGSHMEVWVNHSLARLDAIDLDNLRFGIPVFEAEGVRASILQGQPLAGAATGNTEIGLSLGKLVANIQRLDLNKEIIQLKDFQLDSTSTAVRLGKVPKRMGGAKTAAKGAVAKVGATSGAGGATAAADTTGWRVLAGAIRLNGDNIRFDDDNQPRQKDGMDYAHLGVSQLTLTGRNLNYSSDSISGEIAQGSLVEQSGFRLLRLQTQFLYSDHGTVLRHLLLQTPGTLLQRNASLQYTDLAGMMKDPARTLVDLDLPGSRVQVKDILIFAPFLRRQPLFSHPKEIWQVNARIKGSFDALDVPLLQVSGIQDLRLDVAGKVLHPFDIKRIQTALQVRQISGSRAALVSLLPPGTLPKNITLPDHFDLRGRLNGGMDAIQPDLVLQTTFGTILLKGWARNIRSTTAAAYDLDLQTKALQLGKILQDTLQWGAVTADVTVKGQGLDIHSANASFSGRVASATIRHYTYTHFSLDGSVADQQAKLQSSIRDTAVSFDLTATANLAQKFPALQLDWQIDTLDLRALHFTEDTLQFKGHIAAGFADTNPDSLQGTLKVTGIRLLEGSRNLKTDSIVLVATRQDSIEDIQLHSEMADLDWMGRYKLTEAAQAMQHVINHYYRLNNVKDSAFAAQDWTLRVHFRPSPLVLAYMPSLKGTDSVGMLMRFNSDNNDLQVHLSSPHLQIGSQTFDHPVLTAGTANGLLDYDLQVDGGSGSGFELHKTYVAGQLHDNQLTTAIVLQDEKGKDRFRFAGTASELPGGVKFIFNPDSLLLNYERWQASRDNYVQYDSSGILLHNLAISHDNDSLSISNTTASPASPVRVRFASFSLGTLSHLADQDSLLVDGTLNGTAEIKNMMTHPVFTSDLQITRLTYKTDTLGDLALKVNNEKDSALAADISLEGYKNDLKVKGEYYTGAGRMNLQLNLGQLNLAAFTHLANGEVEDMKGYLKGQLAITGTLDKPLLKGDLHFDSSMVTPVVSGEPLKLSKDNIEFDEDGFNFSQFTLLDSANNKLIIDGNVYTHDYRDFRFDISVNAANFRLVSAPEESSRQFYGSLNLDAAINLEGDVSSPKVDGDIKVNKKTNFYFVLPSPDPEVVGREGVVRFVDHNHPADTLIDRAALIAKAQQSTIQGADISLNIQTDSNATFTMVIDERTGDVLTARGRSTLVFGMDKSGKTSLTGSFEVSSGSYNLSMSVLKRQFVIQSGSVITWTGDPMAATLDLTASYTAVTPAYNLVLNEIESYPQTEQAKFKEKLPFLVTLKMTGELLKPDITFDISLPANVLTLWPEVDQRLQQIRPEESELNKQVFALLLLNQFVGEDPLASATGGGSSVGVLAFQSASQILTNQMNQLAGSLIKGVDLRFDLNNEQDYSTGYEIDYTELDVGVSKKLFNERLQVSVGSNFDVVGTGAPAQAPSNLAGDVSVDYKLSKDGRYRLRAYRQNQYDEVVEGQVVETGLSFILTLDYNSLKDLFSRSHETKLAERTATKPANSAPTPNQ